MVVVVVVAAVVVVVVAVAVEVEVATAEVRGTMEGMVVKEITEILKLDMEVEAMEGKLQLFFVFSNTCRLCETTQVRFFSSSYGGQDQYGGQSQVCRITL